jgi:hypothetical protein
MSVTYTLPLFGIQLDTGINTAVTVRPEAFADGMPAATPGGVDTGIATATAHRPDVANNPALEAQADVPLDAW